jgi:Domain of unknown function (DUF4259)
MGAWGAGSFDNDDAMDWVIGLTEGSGDTLLREALAPVVSAGDRDLEAPDCSIAIAAAESIAAARGRPTASLPEEVAEWVTKKPIVATDLVVLASTAVDRIARKSELKDLWEESDSADDWRAAMTDLRKRLD